MKERIIGRYVGSEKGPLLICIGGIHGNEPAGIEAIYEVLNLLQIEIETNPGFQYHGIFTGLRGNLPAIDQKKRFVERDLNRMLTLSDKNRIHAIPYENRNSEDIQTLELIEAIEDEIHHYNPELVLIIDLHTTTADGGIFTIAAEDSMSRELALSLHAPVILGVAEGLEGTTIEYFNKPEKNQYCIVFEAGQHNDPACVQRSIAAIVGAMKKTGAVSENDVDARHERLLIDQSKGLPKITRLIYHYKVRPDENFIMHPGYTNFQKIKEGEILATNTAGAVTSPSNGLILMPKYQTQGDDGFFIIKEI